MDKITFKKILKEYLDLSSKYALKFHSIFVNRELIETSDYDINTHGIGMKVNDKKKDIIIDFDFFRYDGILIKYFDPWKLNLFSKGKYNLEITKDIIFEMEQKGYIKKYNKSSYYFLI